MKKTTKLKILEYTKLQTIIFALIGLLAGVLYSFGGLIIDTLVSLGWIVSSETPGLSYGTVLAFGALLGMPLYFAVIGFVTGILGAFLFNLTSKWFGGLKMDLKR
jgi:Na+/proline symporter